ncbi:hypothetical protein PWY36_23340, partial [Kribbella solani]|nr:hypothetical protein [Kribbella solani]
MSRNLRADDLQHDGTPNQTNRINRINQANGANGANGANQTSPTNPTNPISPTDPTSQTSPTSPTSPTKENLMRSSAAPDDHADSPVDDLTPDETVPRTAAGAIRAVDPPGSSAGDGAAGTAAGRYGGELTEDALTSRLEVVRRLGIGRADATQAKTRRPHGSRVSAGTQLASTAQVVANGDTTDTEQAADTRQAPETDQAVRTGGGVGGLPVRVPG